MLDTTDVCARRVRHIDATFAGAWELPVIGEVEPPTALLVRPDGYVAWAGTDAADGLAATVRTWFGPPSPSAPPSGGTGVG